MQFVSTRGRTPAVSFSQAVLGGLAPDGGLYVPEQWPIFREGDFADCTSLPEVAERFIAPFAAGDALAAQIPQIVREAFDFPVPLVPVGSAPGFHVLELFHGPTAAFKDFGARFLAACITRLRESAAKPLEILVATSGDTGGAVAAAFHRKPGIRVAVLYPAGLVSPSQERQLTCWGDNVRSFRVRGTFDDCQRMVKEAFADETLRARLDLSSANSINLGRLLPQASYYAHASLDFERRHGRLPSFIIPSGNLGNSLACIWARRCGLPIDRIHLASNANRPVVEFLAGEPWQPRASVATLASAMDVGNPSNMERLNHLYPHFAELAGAVTATSVDDDTIRHRIREDHAAHGVTWCPHTATAAEAWHRLPDRADRPWIVVSTAHPAKFREIVEPLVGEAVAVPASLARLEALATHRVELEPQLAALRRELLS